VILHRVDGVTPSAIWFFVEGIPHPTEPHTRCSGKEASHRVRLLTAKESVYPPAKAGGFTAPSHILNTLSSQSFGGRAGSTIRFMRLLALLLRTKFDFAPDQRLRNSCSPDSSRSCCFVSALRILYPPESSPASAAPASPTVEMFVRVFTSRSRSAPHSLHSQ
jgi:hypothetical protein